MKNLLIVDDDKNFVSKIINRFAGKEYGISFADTLSRAKFLINNNCYDYILANVKIPGGSSLLLRDSGSCRRETKFLFMSNIESDYKFANDNGEKCLYKYNIENSIGALFE